MLNKENYKVRLNCVDVDLAELIYSCMVRMIPVDPVISSSYMQEFDVGELKHLQIQYKNTSSTANNYIFISSNENLLEVN